MTDLLLELAARHPGATQWFGRALLSVCMAIACLGLRLERVERRGHELPSLDQLLPGWVWWAVPESAFGWLVLAAAALGGVATVRLGRQLARF